MCARPRGREARVSHLKTAPLPAMMRTGRLGTSPKKAAVEVPKREGGDLQDREIKQGLMGRGNGRVLGGGTGMSTAAGADRPEEQEQPRADEQKAEAGG